MANPNPIFRQAALDRLASPEQLDQLMQVTTPKSGWALAACCVLVLLAVVWSIVGWIPSRVSGPGILIKQGGVFVTSARSDGNILEIFVNLGDAVTNGQLLANLTLAEMDLKILQARTSQTKLRQELEQLDGYHSQEARTEREEQAQQIQTYEAMAQGYQDQIKAHQERVANIQQLLAGDSPAVSKAQLLDARNSLFLAQSDLAKTHIQIKQVHLNQLQAEERRRQRRADKESQLLQGDHNWEFLTQLHRLNSEIRSPVDGNVIEIMVKPGQLIMPNSPIISLQKGREKLEAHLFLPAAQGKQVHTGMEVRIAPASVKKELFGLMLGTVNSVAPFPSRPESMQRILENPTLVKEFSQAGAPIEVVVELTPKPTPSGYGWTSGRGPALFITSGTLCEGSITLTNRRPISLVLPLFNESMPW